MEIEGGIMKLQNYINGAFEDAAAHLDSFDPSTGKVHAHVPNSTAEDVGRAVEAAKAAFGPWSSTPRAARARLLNLIADKIEERIDIFAAAESKDQGKPFWLAKAVDIPRACYNFRFFAGAILHHVERSSMLEAMGCVNYTDRNPLGVAGLITPWNLPLYLLTWKIAPALATGNTVVAKPSEFTSVTAYLMTQVMAEIGLPAGVCNIVYGLGSPVGSAIVQHPDVPLISFTGGTVTGRRISEMCAPMMKKMSLELGGKNPSIICADVDVAQVVAETVRSCFTNQGEICLCMSRLYVHEDVYDTFVEQFVKATRALKVGSPREPDTKLGALVSKEHLAKVKGYVEIARKEGATVICGDGVDPPLELPVELSGGYFMQPTILADLRDDSRCVMEEIFGPVVGLLKWRDEADVIARANSTCYGLAACIWSKDGSRAQRIAKRVHSGTVWINCWMVRDLNMPFGGMKGSGTGRESGEESIDFYTEAKTVCYKFE